jgi:hypothetical protein
VPKPWDRAASPTGAPSTSTGRFPLKRHPPAAVLTLVLADAVLAGCGQDHTRAAVTGARTATVTWSGGPVTVSHQPAVPPVPVVTGIRYAGHPAEGYDRTVLGIRGSGLPGRISVDGAV